MYVSLATFHRLAIYIGVRKTYIKIWYEITASRKPRGKSGLDRNRQKAAIMAVAI